LGGQDSTYCGSVSSTNPDLHKISDRTKIREGQVSNRPIYVAMGITIDGERDVLGLWSGPPGGGEGARQWLAMLSELKNRGVTDVLIACCDGLKG
jgi:putative transposase